VRYFPLIILLNLNGILGPLNQTIAYIKSA